MAFEEEPWGRYTGKRRALAIRDWLKHDPHTGWTRPGGERVLWNGATEEAHQRAADDPNRLPWPTNIPDPLPPLATDQPKPSAFPIPAPPPPEPKSLQIFWNDYLKAADGKTEMYRAWYYFEGKPGQKVDPCTDDWDMRDAVLDDTVDKELDFFGPYEPDWDSPPRIEGESIMNFKFKDQKACKFQGLGDKGPSGDVGWLHCPGREAIMCLEPPEWSKGKDGWSICNEYQRYVPVAYCDWV